MKKFAYVIAALAAIAVAAPSIASAETVVVRHGGWHEGVHRDHMRGDYWHPHHDRVVVIRHGHHHHGY
jgi:hypothetical protein